MVSKVPFFSCSPCLGVIIGEATRLVGQSWISDIFVFSPEIVNDLLQTIVLVLCIPQITLEFAFAFIELCTKFRYTLLGIELIT